MDTSRRNFLLGRRTLDTTGPRRALIGSACIAARDNVVCRSCGDACEAGAIRFRPRLGGAALPELDADACTGCGECAPACPAGAVTMAGREETERSMA